ncbi:MAG: 50S ribosomal protein L11 methyltransferase [Cytophagaceae bacterium]
MQYLKIKIQALVDYHELLIAELNLQGYDSFEEREDGIDAYVVEETYQEQGLQELSEKYKDLFSFTYTSEKLENKNWNEEWEKNFQPVIISSRCIVRASFHQPDKVYDYDIVINPKMSFGTGHHETTSMMIENQLGIDHRGKKVMDAGSGTGILAIMAAKLGAADVSAFDVEDWAYQNLKENISLNGCHNISAALGDISNVDLHNEYDIILANINKNVLMAEIPVYAKKLSKGGILVLSGFYTGDSADLIEVAQKSGLVKASDNEKNRWASLIFNKK